LGLESSTVQFIHTLTQLKAESRIVAEFLPPLPFQLPLQASAGLSLGFAFNTLFLELKSPPYTIFSPSHLAELYSAQVRFRYLAAM
jgi:hypothetical protein